MASGLRKWVAEKWVDIGAPKKDGKYQPCGRSKGSKRAYPKCVPLAKATRMTKSQKASAVSRKRAAPNTGPKPSNVKTFTKRTKAANGYIGSAINSNYGGVKLNNPTYAKYYKGMI
jgi:ABC-type phosphate transport system substrate-binding protein